MNPIHLPSFVSFFLDHGTLSCPTNLPEQRKIIVVPGFSLREEEKAALSSFEAVYEEG